MAKFRCHQRKVKQFSYVAKPIGRSVTMEAFRDTDGCSAQARVGRNRCGSLRTGANGGHGSVRKGTSEALQLQGSCRHRLTRCTPVVSVRSAEPGNLDLGRGTSEHTLVAPDAVVMYEVCAIAGLFGGLYYCSVCIWHRRPCGSAEMLRPARQRQSGLWRSRHIERREVLVGVG